jgi:16S rRNA (guanine(1405)-N(7))-methyltransferase
MTTDNGQQTTDNRQLDDLINAVLDSPKYRTICVDLVRRIGLRELESRRNFKESVKATRNKLHQVAGAYFESKPDYAGWTAQLEQTAGDSEQLRSACLSIMRRHASTRERLGILEQVYATTLANIPPVHSILDVACGLNPLAHAWMPLAPDATYYACDIYSDMIDFLNTFFTLASVPGNAFVCDLISHPPQHEVDLALALKILPPLEQVDKSAGINLLRSLNARHVLVSFPAQSLSGRNKRMAENYEQRFRTLVADEGWNIERFAFSNELAFFVRKKPRTDQDAEQS